MTSPRLFSIGPVSDNANWQLCFRSVLQYFASLLNLWFSKLSQGFKNGLLQGFTKDSQVRKSFASIRNGHFVDAKDVNHVLNPYACIDTKIST